jgi:hypothetical protein
MNGSGYIKLWRSTLDNGVLRHPHAWQVFGYCLLNAVWKPVEHITTHGVVSLKPGQFVTGRKKMSRELHTTEQKIRTALKLLATMKILTIEITKNFSVITLVNWSKFQVDDSKSTSESTSTQPALNQHSTTEEEGKKVRTRQEPKINLEKKPDSYLLKIARRDYYELFDPRHPGYFDRQSPKSNAELQAAWEAEHGKPWTPKPDLDETKL